MATVFPANNFNAQADAEVLHEAMKGLGTDEQAIIDILSCRSLSQRQRIEAAFKSIYGIDLKQKLHKELSGKFRLAVLYSFYDQAHVNAKSIYRAIKGAGTDETILIDVICSSTNEEIHELKKAYDDILKEKKQNLNCPWEEIVAIDTVYSQAVGHDLPTAIEKETSGDYKHALLALFKTAVSRERYYAEVLYKSMKGLGTHDENLVRMIMAHCEVDLANIKEVFETMYGKTLEDMVKSDTSGDQRKFLLAMMGARME
uniref:Annexin n=1 Tax=Mesocestoides corti TaxID=53468 RepID=A0A5K3EY45_MESCO